MPELKLKSILQKCGVVGAGGAGFPSYAKLTEGADLLVINCIECEPLMYTDYELVREKLPEVVQGAQLVMECEKLGLYFLPFWWEFGKNGD